MMVKNGFIDLHTHTIYSDGGLTPTELVQKAKETGLAAIAIADHDSVSGLPEGFAEAERQGVELVPAIEMSSYPNDKTEYHILGYFIDWEDKWLQDTLAHFQKVREERAEKVVEKLKELGYKITFDEVKAQAKGTIVQPHIAYVVVNDPENSEKLTREFGQMPKTGDFIREHLIPGKDAYIAREKLTPKEAIELIHRVGGIAVLAHPCWNLCKKVEDKLVFDDQPLAELVQIGLDGIEVYCHRENEADTKEAVEHYLQKARLLNLVVSGGSDFHGYGSAGKQLGFTDFYLKVQYSVLQELKSFKVRSRM